MTMQFIIILSLLCISIKPADALAPPFTNILKLERDLKETYDTSSDVLTSLVNRIARIIYYKILRYGYNNVPFPKKNGISENNRDTHRRIRSYFKSHIIDSLRKNKKVMIIADDIPIATLFMRLLGRFLKTERELVDIPLAVPLRIQYSSTLSVDNVQIILPKNSQSDDKRKKAIEYLIGFLKHHKIPHTVFDHSKSESLTSVKQPFGEIILMHHGEPETFLAGQTNIELTEIGRANGKSAGEALEAAGTVIDTVFTSAKDCAINTWENIVEAASRYRKVLVDSDARLNDRDAGALTGWQIFDIKNTLAGIIKELWFEQPNLIGEHLSDARRIARIISNRWDEFTAVQLQKRIQQGLSNYPTFLKSYAPELWAKISKLKIPIPSPVDKTVYVWSTAQLDELIKNQDKDKHYDETTISLITISGDAVHIHPLTRPAQMPESSTAKTTRMSH